MNKNKNFEVGENLYPLVFYAAGLIVLMTLAFFFIQANVLTNEGNLQGASYLVTAGGAFLLMIIGTFVAIALLKDQLPDFKTILPTGKKAATASAYAFVIGLVLWTLIVGVPVTQSTIALNVTDSFFSSAAGALPSFEEKFLLTIAAPVAEEFAFNLGVIIVSLALITVLLNSFNIKINNWLKVSILIIIAIFSAYSFAYFHVANLALTAFIIAAILFRLFLVGITWFDYNFDVIPFAALGIGFAFGVHHANNIVASGGWVEFLQVMLYGGVGNPFLVLAGFFVVFVYFGGNVLIVLHDIISRVVNR